MGEALALMQRIEDYCLRSLDASHCVLTVDCNKYMWRTLCHFNCDGDMVLVKTAHRKMESLNALLDILKKLENLDKQGRKTKVEAVSRFETVVWELSAKEKRCRKMARKFATRALQKANEEGAEAENTARVIKEWLAAAQARGIKEKEEKEAKIENEEKEVERKTKQEAATQLFQRIERVLLSDIADDEIVEELTEEYKFDVSCKRVKLWQTAGDMIGVAMERTNTFQILGVLCPDDEILPIDSPVIMPGYISSCCKRGDIRLLRFLIKTFNTKIIHPDSPTTPLINCKHGILIAAVQDDNDSLVRLLLSEFRDRREVSTARFNEMLQSRDPDADDNNILHFAVYSRAKKVLNLLKDKFQSNVNWNIQNREGWTPLGIAASNEDLESLTLLLSVGSINVNIAGWGGNMVLEMSVAENLYQVISVLLNSGHIYDRDETDLQGMTVAEHITRNRKISSLLNVEKSSKKRRKLHPVIKV